MHLARTSGRCPWLQHLSARHVRRPQRGPAIGGGAARHPPTPPPPRPGPELRPRRRVPASVRGAPWGSRASHPLSLLGQSQAPRAGSRARGGAGALRGDGRGRSHNLSRLRAVGGSSRSLRPDRPLSGDPARLAPEEIVLRALRVPLVQTTRNDMEEFLQRAKSKLVS